MSYYVKVIENGVLQKYMISSESVIEIPENVHTVASDCFRPELHDNFTKDILYDLSNWDHTCKIETVVIRENIKFIEDGAFCGLPNLKSFEVATDCTAASVYDDVLFSRDGKKLISCPTKKQGDLVVPRGTEKICEGAFEETELKRICLPDGLICIDDYFTYGYCLEEIYIPSSVVDITSLAFKHCENLVIKAPGGSYAIQYAMENNIAYEEISPEVITDMANSKKQEYWILVRGDDGNPCRAKRFGYAYEWNGFTFFSDRIIPSDDTVFTEKRSGKALCAWSEFIEIYAKDPEKITKMLTGGASVLDFPEY